MKKVATIFLMLSILSAATGCDYVRKFAGRPTSADLEQLSKEIQQYKKDSTAKAELAAQKKLEDEKRRADSLAKAEISVDFEIKFGDTFHYGEPSSTQMKKYNVVIGVYRYLATFGDLANKITGFGFEPFEISFPDGEYALCLGAADTLEELRDLILRGRSFGVCPKDAWVYENNLQ